MDEKEWTKYINNCALEAIKKIVEIKSTPEGRKQWEFELDIINRRTIIHSGQQVILERQAAQRYEHKRYIG